MEGKSGSSFFKKVSVFIIAALVAVYPIAALNSELLPDFLPKPIFSALAALIAVCLILLFIRLTFKEKKSGKDSSSVVDTFAELTAYFLALSFMKWALLKFFHLHMTTSLAWMEMPQTMLSGYQKVSHFYGQNYPMVFTLGLIEFFGAVFILFRKTRLLGAFILTVACINILMVDVFYGITRPILEALILFTGSVYFILRERKAVLELFFRRKEEIKPDDKSRLFLALKLSALVIPILVFYPNYKKQFKPGITGKYEIVNIQNTDNNPKVKDISTNYDYVYFDLGEYFAFTSKDFKKRQVGRLEMDEKTRKFRVTWISGKSKFPALYGELSVPDSSGQTTLIGEFNKQSFNILLRKQALKSIWKTY